MIRCKVCFDRRVCPTCQGDGALPMAPEGQACPVCGGAGGCPRCQLRQPDPEAA